MTQRNKAEQRIMSYPIKLDITYEEVKSFLLSKDFEIRKGQGDHMIFTHPELKQHLSIPCCVKAIKTPYIKAIQKAINLICGSK